jgi:acyl carrier protein
MITQKVDHPWTESQDRQVQKILAIVRGVLAKPDLGADDDVMDHGGTSLSVVRILTESEQALGLTVDPRELNGTVTAHNLVQAAH